MAGIANETDPARGGERANSNEPACCLVSLFFNGIEETQ
jgi:hypothetical protein